MDFFQAENNQQELLELINREKSPRVVLVKIVDFIDQIIQNFDSSYSEAFICELLPHLNPLLKKYSPYGFEPRVTHEIIDVLVKIVSIEEFKPYLASFNNEIVRIKNQLLELEKTLSGWNKQIKNSNSVHFPIIEKSTTVDNSFALLDSLQVSLVHKKKMKANEFLLHPSAIDVEKRINAQVENSWKYAEDYIERKYGRKIPNFQIIINFEKHYAIYEGGSLGIALTIGLISELLRYFDLRDDLYLQNNIVTTGAVSEDGTILKMTKSIIETKLKAVFFSNFSNFLIPKEDEQIALNYLKSLNKNYPDRELNIIGCSNIAEIINRRDLIEIKVKSTLLWGLKVLIRKKIVIFLAILFFVHSGTYYLLKIDNNPTRIDFSDNRLFVKNGFDEILWSKDYNLTPKMIKTVNGIADLKTRIIDIDDDGTNEVLITNLPNKETRDHNFYLFSSSGEVIWKFNYVDSIETLNEQFYGSFDVLGIIDTIHNQDRIELLIYMQHYNYYPSGILKLNLLTGEKISDILWHPGSIAGATLRDWNNDGKKEIIAVGASNGMQKAYLFSVDHDKLHGTFPTAKNYYFKDLPLADFNHYMLFPQTDYSQHFFSKYNAILGIPLKVYDFLSVNVFEGHANFFESKFRYTIRLGRKLNPKQVIVADQSVEVRNSLIRKKILNPPFTESREFQNSILNNIEYWNGKDFVKFDE